MALTINAQYTAFIQFAEQQSKTGNETAIARDGGEAADHVITVADGDKIKPIFRSTANERANDAVRDALLEKPLCPMQGHTPSA